MINHGEGGEIMRKMEHKMAQMAEIRAGLAKFRFRQLPSASVSFRGQRAAVVSLISDFYPPCSVGNFADGRREGGNYEENGAQNGPNGRNKGGIGQISLPSASVSFRQLPRTSNTCV